MIKIQSVTDDAFLETVTQKLRDFNDSVSPYHRESRQPGAIQTIALKALEGEILAGSLIADIYWGWLDLKKLFVEEAFRHQGVGSMLLQEAEALAKAQGTTRGFLTTYEFQAKSFYEKHGYSATGVLKDYPLGSAYYWMTKTL